MEVKDLVQTDTLRRMIPKLVSSVRNCQPNEFQRQLEEAFRIAYVEGWEDNNKLREACKKLCP